MVAKSTVEQASRLSPSFFIGRLLLAVALTAAAPWPTFAETITLTPAADTTLSENYPDHNFGALMGFNSGTTQNSYLNRGLLKFDLASALPADSVILAAALTLEVVHDPNEDFPEARFNLHRMLRPWGEGRGTNTPGGGMGQGSPALTNEATWTHRFAFTPEEWSQPGAAAPTDFTSIVSSGVTAAGVDQSPYTVPSTPQLIDDLQRWFDQPETNFGWLLLCEQENTRFTARQFGSREDESNAPRLEINYLVRPRLVQARKVGDEFEFTFTVRAGQSYRVEVRGKLDASDWLVLTNLGLMTETAQVVVRDTNAPPQRFYRVATE